MNYETLDRTIRMKCCTLNHLRTGRAINAALWNFCLLAELWTLNFETSAYWQKYELWTLKLPPIDRTMNFGFWNFCLLAELWNIELWNICL